MNANYWFNDNMQLFLDIINLTDETSHVHGRTEYQTLFATQQGVRYNLGFRSKY